jgi:hypothetical protein
MDFVGSFPEKRGKGHELRVTALGYGANFLLVIMGE